MLKLKNIFRQGSVAYFAYFTRLNIFFRTINLLITLKVFQVILITKINWLVIKRGKIDTRYYFNMRY